MIRLPKQKKGMSNIAFNNQKMELMVRVQISVAIVWVHFALLSRGKVWIILPHLESDRQMSNSSRLFCLSPSADMNKTITLNELLFHCIALGSFFLPDSILHDYKSIICPRFEYRCHIWSGTNFEDLDNIQRICYGFWHLGINHFPTDGMEFLFAFSLNIYTLDYSGVLSALANWFTNSSVVPDYHLDLIVLLWK